MSKTQVTYKDPKEASIWLDAALEKERHKYANSPVNHKELVGGCIAANAWGFVALGYFLLEMSFKLQLHMLQKKIQMDHSLLKTLPAAATRPSGHAFRVLRPLPFQTVGGTTPASISKTLEKYVRNLDGQNDKGYSDWRYYLIEEKQGPQMPLVSIGFLHEIIHGSNRLVGQLCNPRWDARSDTFSKRTLREQTAILRPAAD